MPRDMKSALGNSLKAEEEAVKSRFEKAENVLARSDFSESLAAPPEDTPHLPQGSKIAPALLPDDSEKVKRDSFTMPLTDYERIASLQKRCLRSGIGATKSEILRAGLVALAAMTDAELSAMVEELPKVKTGRRPTSSQNTV